MTAARVVVALLLAACMPTFRPIDCGDLTEAGCKLAVDAAVPLLSPVPDRMVVLGSPPSFLVMGCHADESASVVDVLIGDGGEIDARLREGGPDIRHLCLGDPPP